MTDQVIEHPTYMEHIRHFFEDIDLEHMKTIGIDLSTYDQLKDNSTDVFFQTEPPGANMPPEADRKWSSEKSQSFMNWIRDGHPLGVPKRSSALKLDVNVSRIRKDVRDLSSDEILQLKAAFQGIINRPIDDPNSYYSIAGLHWYPLPFKCKHHESRYNPWHRAYLMVFEDALRSVPGCEDVTLPYWDILTEPPAYLYDHPLGAYTLPENIHNNYPAGYITQRYSATDIANNVQTEDISTTIGLAMSEPFWEDFVTFTGQGIEAAHDAGHGACGITISNPDAASFDPLFWFFHANWDRLWWIWQIQVHATTQWSFRSTIKGSTAFLEAPFNDLDPFSLNVGETIDLSGLDVSYEPYSEAEILDGEIRFGVPRFGSTSARISPNVSTGEMVSIRLKGIDRINIPGSFRAILEADGKEIGRRTFFQSTIPQDCENCRNQRKINLDFNVQLLRITNKSLNARIELVTPLTGIGKNIPLHACGNPSINVRHLLTN